MSERTIEDGFGSCWELCDRQDCGLQVVRPGKAQCDCNYDEDPQHYDWERDGE